MKRIIGIALASSVMMISCGENEQKSISGEKVVNVKVATAVNQKIGKLFEYPGKVNAGSATNLSTRIMGQINAIKVDIGDPVKKDQVLLTIRSNDIAARKAQVEANILESEAAYASAEKDYNRITQLFAVQSASQKELDDITTHYKMMQAKLKAVKQLKPEVDEMLRHTVIRAPYDGVVASKMVNIGDMANPGIPLLSIESSGVFEVTAKVPETEINQIKKGEEVKVLIRALNQPELKGRVIQVNQSLRFSGSQYDVKIELIPNAGQKLQIRSGMFANVHIQNGNESCILIPEEAFIKRGQLTGLWAVNQQNEALLRWVRTGKQFGNKLEILSGISNGEKYISNAEGRLYDGIKINVRN